MSRRRIPVLAAAITLATPLPALATGPQLSLPRTFASGNPFVPSGLSWTSVALNSRGDAVVGGTIARSADSIPVVRQRTRARGPWSAPVRLAAGHPRTSAPVVAVNEGGSAIAVFGSGNRLWAARRGPSGAWRSSPSPVVWPLSPRHVERVSLLADGRARLVMAQAGDTCTPGIPCVWTITVLQQPAGGGGWTAVGSPIDVPPVNGVPRLAMSRTGHVLAAWNDGGRTLGMRVLATEPSGEPPAELAPVVDASPAIGDGGDAAVAYGVEDAPGIGRGFVRLRPATQGWGAPEEVVPATAGTPWMRVAVDGEGNVATAWTRFTTGRRTVGASARRSHVDGSWVRDAGFTTSSGDESLQVARIGADGGQVLIIWDGHLGPGANVVHLATSGWAGLSSTITDYGYPPSGFGMAADGDALIVDHDMTVRNVDTTATPAALRVLSPRVRVRGRSATVSLYLTVPATVFLQRVGPLGGRSRTQLAAPRVMAAGTRRITLGPLAPGRYQVWPAGCNAARGCAFSQPGFVTFRIR